LQPLAPQPLLLQALHLLTAPSSGSPLAFFAGSTRPSLISSIFLSNWILELPPAPSSAAAPSTSASTSAAAEESEEPEEDQIVLLPTPPAKKKRVLPCVWIDLNGEVNRELWNRAVGWVEGELMMKAGSTLVRFFFEGFFPLLSYLY
jgi:hypothetical protein